MQKLRIAQISPYWFDVPPKNYGGTERVISYITEELVSRGHNVTLYAPPGSQTNARLISPLSAEYPKAVESYIDPFFSGNSLYVNAEVFKQADEFDIIHSHAYYFSFPFSEFVKTPVVHTLHNQLPREREIENLFMRRYKDLNFVSISQEFRTHFDLNYVSTVYHGLDLEFFPFNEVGGDYLFWMGRVSKNKGEDIAIEVAQKVKRKLKMAASIRKDTADRFKKIIDSSSEYLEVLQNVKFEETWKHYGGARSFIFPVQWREPFGLILIESMACGTPVIAYAKGSIPEIIKDGETGFIVNPSDAEIVGDWIVKKTGIEGLCEAVEKVYSLPDQDYLRMRKNCRSHVEKNFTVKQMVDKYEEVYAKILNPKFKMVRQARHPEQSRRTNP